MARFIVSEAGLAKIGAEAAERRADMHQLYIVTFIPSQMVVWGDIAGAIEAEGWALEHFALAKEGHAVAVFRRTKGL